MTKKTLCLFILLAFGLQYAWAQRTAIHDEPEATYRQALELFNKEQYGAARNLFLQTLRQVDDTHSKVYANAQLHAAICATELFNPDAEELLLTYLREHPSHAGKTQARFHMGNLKYRQRDYEEAVGWFARLDANAVDSDREDEFLFKKGYSLFQTDSYNTANQYFERVTDPASAYYSPATYYRGHIAYITGDYEVAMSAFQQLTDDRNFGPVVPYYITHIHFLQENFDSLLAYAPDLLEERTTRRSSEIARLLGEAHSRQSQYAEAIPYLEDYINAPRSGATREDHYQLGFAYLHTGSHEEAIDHFERVTTREDSLSQNAHYHLASCYIETGQKRYARNAFTQAHQLDFDDEIARESLFNYALLSLELSYDPYNEAIRSFQQFIETYPESPRTQEAYEHLIDLYLTTSNYKNALSSLEEITIDSPTLREAYQRVSFYRGVELFNNGDFMQAIEHFEKTRRFEEERGLFAASLYWTGEAYYRLSRYDDAITAHETFLVTPGAFTLDIYNQANYTIGYAHFKEERYPRAISALRKFIDESGEKPQMINDALLRVADSYFMNKQYPQARDFYDRAINLGVIDTDYAIFQKGLVQGIRGNNEEKLTTMNTLINNHPQSGFVDDAMYEIANTWLILDNNDRARTHFNRLIEQHPNSSYAQSARLKTGLIHYNLNEDERALEVFREVIEDYPGTSEAREAFSAMRSIYVDLDRVDEFVRFSEEMGMADMTTAQEDSLTYEAAENRYMQGDCQEAIQSFSNYLDRFPDGIFSTNARYYRAECYFRTNDRQHALEGYTHVIEQTRSKFLENALLRASTIHYDMGHYEKANQYFLQLEEVAEYRNNMLVARKGQMRSQYRLERYADAIEASQAVIDTDKVSRDVEQEAQLIIGISALEQDNREMAENALRQAKEMADNERAAEAMYHLALITFRQGHYDEAEDQIFEYVNQMSAYDYWLAKTFLLLSDIYIETDNLFQAKHTLESIIENYDGELLLHEAKERMAFIDEQEEMRDMPQEIDTLEIEMGDRE